MSEIMNHGEVAVSAIKCLNCENPFEGKFCNQCGQKSTTHRFTMHDWWHEIPHSLFHVDSGFFYTIKNLILRPGDAILDYLNGKRKLLFSPFLYVLLMCGFFVVVSYLLPSIEKGAISEIKTVMAMTGYLQKHYYKIIVVVMIIPMAIGSYIVYFRSGFNFAEHLVLNTYLIAQMVIVDMISEILKAGTHNAKPGIAIFDFLTKYLYWAWVYWQFFKPKSWIFGGLQFLFAIFAAGIFLSALLSSISYAVLKFKGAV